MTHPEGTEGVTDADAKSNALSREVRELRSLLEQERLQRSQLLASTSWRVTAPLRKLKERLISRKPGVDQVHGVVSSPNVPAQLSSTSAGGCESGANETYRLLDVASATASLASAPRLPAVAERIGFIGSSELLDDLRPDISVEVLREGSWLAQLRDRRVDYVLLETAWTGAAGDWRYTMVREAGRGQELIELLEYCRSNRIPSVLWIREDPRNYHQYSWLIPLVDRVYAIDEAVGRLITAEFPDRKPGILAPAVQPAVHNPVRSYALQQAHEQFRELLLFDGWWELVGDEELRGVARDLGHEGLRICESRWEFGRVRLGDMPQLAPHVLGCVDGWTKAVLNKLFGLELFLPARLTPPWRQRQQMLRAAVGGTLVASLAQPEGTPDEVVSWSGGQDEVQGWWRNLLADPSSLARKVHLVRRRILQSHSIRHRLDQIAIDLGFRSGPGETDPRVSMVLVTMRPQLLEGCLDRFRRDLYPNKELIVVLHGEHDLTHAKRLVRPGEAIRVMQLGRERSLGACLNFAIELSEGEYWAKVDDDDLYGPHYLTDLMLSRRVIDFDLAGKPPVFAYLEGRGALYHDPVWEAHAHLWHAPSDATAALVAGGTLTGKRTLLEHVRFCEKRRGGSDSDFIRRCYESGRGVLATDGFNFVRYRSSASGFHTWQMDEADLVQRGSRIGGRDEIADKVFI